MSSPGERKSSHQEEDKDTNTSAQAVEGRDRVDAESKSREPPPPLPGRIVTVLAGEIPPPRFDIFLENGLATFTSAVPPSTWYSPYGRYETIDGLLSALRVHDRSQSSVEAYQVQQIRRIRDQNQVVRAVQEDLEAQGEEYRDLQASAARASALAREEKKREAEREAEREAAHKAEHKVKREDDRDDERKVARQPRDMSARGTSPDGRATPSDTLASHDRGSGPPALHARPPTLLEAMASDRASRGLPSEPTWEPPGAPQHPRLHAPEAYPYGVPPNVALGYLPPPSATPAALRRSAPRELVSPTKPPSPKRHSKRARRSHHSFDMTELDAIAVEREKERSEARRAPPLAGRSLRPQRQMEPRLADLAVALAVRQDTFLDELCAVVGGFQTDYDSAPHGAQAAMVQELTSYLGHWAQQVRPSTRIQRRAFAPFSNLPVDQGDEDIVIDPIIRPFDSVAHDVTGGGGGAAAADLGGLKQEEGSKHREVKDEGESEYRGN